MKKILANCYLWALLLILYAPVLIIFIFSFTEGKVLGSWNGFSLNLYSNFFKGEAGPLLTSAIINTVVIALVSATISTILGSLAAIGIYNMRSSTRRAINFVNSVPIINPDIITGISIFLLYVFCGITRGMGTVICAHVAFCTPYVVLSVMPRLMKMNPNLYEAAIDLGATPFVALRKVLFPELKPGILSGFILAVTLSIDDFAVTLFNKGSGGIETLSTFIYADARKGGLTPELRPLFSIIFLTILILLIIFNIRNAKQNDKKKFLIITTRLMATISAAAQTDRAHTLKVYNWADYMDMDLIPEFEEYYEQETGEPVKIVYQTYDINENMLTEIEVGHEDYDVVCPSEYIIERMLRKGLLQKIDTNFVETTENNYKNVSPWIREKLELISPSDTIRVGDYAVGYFWGTTGFLYNKAYVDDDDVKSWGAIHNPKFQGQIFIKDAFRDVYSVMIQYAKYQDITAGIADRQHLACDLSDIEVATVLLFAAVLTGYAVSGLNDLPAADRAGHSLHVLSGDVCKVKSNNRLS